MPKRKARGTFIPYRRADIIEMCLSENYLSEEEKDQFRTFCRILIAYYHYCFHDKLSRLKDFFIPIDPDSPYKKFKQKDEQEDPEKIKSFFEDFEYLLQKANYRCLSEEELKASLDDKTLIQLNYDIDFDAMDHYVIYARGISRTTETIRNYFTSIKKTLDFDVYNRVVLVLKYKGDDYFRSKKINVDNLNFKPDHTYIYYYKNIPVNDLEILFPNVRIKMTLKDQLLFWVPTIGAGLGSVWKVLSNIAIVVGFILFLLGLEEIAKQFDIEINEEMINNSIYPMLLATSSILLVLGGFAVKQYLRYKNKFIYFMKRITDTLFFRCISINSGVFQTLVDSAEEEECKEAILAYYHLLITKNPLNLEELDLHIENWFEEKFDTRLDFDVEDAVEKLHLLEGMVYDHSIELNHKVRKPLIEKDEHGKFTVKSIQEGVVILDAIWDDIFLYNKASKVCTDL